MFITAESEKVADPRVIQRPRKNQNQHSVQLSLQEQQSSGPCQSWSQKGVTRIEQVEGKRFHFFLNLDYSKIFK